MVGVAEGGIFLIFIVCQWWVPGMHESDSVAHNTAPREIESNVQEQRILRHCVRGSLQIWTELENIL